MDATITLQDGMHFVAVPDSGMVVHIDSKPETGERQGASPMELLLVSLGVVGFLAVQAVGIMPVLANSRSAAMEMPMAWLYGVVAAGLAGGVLRILVGIVAELRR